MVEVNSMKNLNSHIIINTVVGIFLAGVLFFVLYTVFNTQKKVNTIINFLNAQYPAQATAAPEKQVK